MDNNYKNKQITLRSALCCSIERRGCGAMLSNGSGYTLAVPLPFLICSPILKNN